MEYSKEDFKYRGSEKENCLSRANLSLNKQIKRKLSYRERANYKNGMRTGARVRRITKKLVKDQIVIYGKQTIISLLLVGSSHNYIRHKPN
jgi:hypothetical protein